MDIEWSLKLSPFPPADYTLLIVVERPNEVDGKVLKPLIAFTKCASYYLFKRRKGAKKKTAKNSREVKKNGTNSVLLERTS
jgi:hypothetical protein